MINILKKKFKIKRFACLVLAFASMISVNTLALTDDYILNDDVKNIYGGSGGAVNMLQYLNFTDVGRGFWAQEVIVRSGALNLIKGYGDTFAPASPITKEEAIVLVMRMLNYESDAIDMGAVLAAEGVDESASGLWSLGFIYYAAELGIISWYDFEDAISSEPLEFFRTDPATREEVAAWVYTALRTLDANLFTPPAELTKIFTFNDWREIGIDKLYIIEAIAENGIMRGSPDGSFYPKNPITRAEMAQVLANTESIYFGLKGIEKKSGTVGAIRDNMYTTTGNADLWRNIYVRTSEGTVDVLQYEQAVNSSPQSGVSDAVVFKDYEAVGLLSLGEGDQIEYLIDSVNGTVLYVRVTGSLNVREVEGQLSTVDAASGTINITNANGDIHYIYSTVEGLISKQNGSDTLLIDSERKTLATLPYGSIVKLTLVNDIVIAVAFVGQEVLVEEIRGVVVENSPQFGYLTIIGNNGDRITMRYYENDLLVRKLQYYDMTGGLSYYSQMFPNFSFDSSVTAISQIEPGDVVFIRPMADEPNIIAQISAATNYIMRYGKILQINRYADYMSVLIEFENKQTAWFNISDGIFISKNGKPIPPASVMLGDWVKLLVNEAVIEPGYVIRSVKEMTVEGGEYYISNIIKGSLSSINTIQNQLVIQGAQTLAKTGWTNYRDLVQLSLASRDIEYYYGDTRITLDYAVKYFQQSNMTVYIALENYSAGERIKKVTFRAGRDEPLAADIVSYASGGGVFTILSYTGNITADSGTIVRRYGRLVGANDVMSSDYLSVVLNGDGKAAIIDIVEAPDTSQVMISRARVSSVNEGVSFTAQSVSMLSGTSWVYTPVQREYSIDGRTLFLNAAGYVDPASFIGITQDTVVDKVYNVVSDGTRASYVVEAPYADEAVRGTIYSINGSSVTLRDVQILDLKTNKWQPVSAQNNYITLTLQPNTVIAKNNAIVVSSALVPGDQLLVMTDSLPAVQSGMMVTGFIVLVEK